MLSSLFEMLENGHYTVWRITISYSWGPELSVKLTCGIWQMWARANVLCQANLARVEDWWLLIFIEQPSEIWLMAAIKESYQPQGLYQRCGVKEYWIKHLGFEPSSAINHFVSLDRLLNLLDLFCDMWGETYRLYHILGLFQFLGFATSSS